MSFSNSNKDPTRTVDAKADVVDVWGSFRSQFKRYGADKSTASEKPSLEPLAKISSQAGEIVKPR